MILSLRGECFLKSFTFNPHSKATDIGYLLASGACFSGVKIINHICKRVRFYSFKTRACRHAHSPSQLPTT
ncbi:hypothetical protein FYJ25_07830 [Anaerobutyricum soehngenii]|uniref:Uncharacterized protein n=1 Tax=Anaerobutyricum soehngenii TaxID=105843 RepID=A0A6N7XZM5_9FIRM|nr:hypothetical protein [Anaerobutyricum soehngenii]